MKNLFLLVVFFFLLSCEVKFQSAQANTNNDSHFIYNPDNNVNKVIDYTTIEIEGMEYAVFGAAGGPGGVGVAVVNLTKDKLEIELLKKQLNRK